MREATSESTQLNSQPQLNIENPLQMGTFWCTPSCATYNRLPVRPMHKCTYENVEGIFNSDNSVTFYGIVFETINEAIKYIEFLRRICQEDSLSEKPKIAKGDEYCYFLWC